MQELRPLVMPGVDTAKIGVAAAEKEPSNVSRKRGVRMGVPGGISGVIWRVDVRAARGCARERQPRAPPAAGHLRRQ